MCFSLEWLKAILVYLVVICAIIAILKIIVPWVLGKLASFPALTEAIGIITQIIWIIIYAVIVIFVIYVAFDLIQCLLSYAGGFPSLPRR